MATIQDYLIAIQLQCTGDAPTKAKLGQVKQALGLLQGTTDKVSQSQQGMADVIQKAAARALLVAPIWLTLRAAMQFVVGTTQDMIKANLELDESMATIKGLMSVGFTGNLGPELKEIENLIRETSLKSTLSIKELSDAWIELKSSGNSTTEAMAAWIPTWQLMQGQNVKAKEAAQALDLMFDLMGSKMSKTATTSEKFAQIGDILAFTHAKWGMSVNDVQSAYAKLGPYLDTVKGGLTELTTIMGVLNDRGIAGGRIGTSLSQSFVKVVTNAKELSAAFNLKVDTSKQLDIIDFMTKLSIAIKKVGPEALKTNAAMVKVFGNEKTGAGAVTLAKNIDLIVKSIAEANANADGFNAKMAEFNMNTVSGQTKLWANNMANLGNNFWNAASGGDSFIESLKKMNEALKSDETVKKLMAIGDAIHYLVINAKLMGADIGEPFAVLGALSSGQIKNMKQLSAATADNTEEIKKYFDMLMTPKKPTVPPTNLIANRLAKEELPVIPPPQPITDESTYIVNGKKLSATEYTNRLSGQPVTNNDNRIQTVTVHTVTNASPEDITKAVKKALTDPQVATIVPVK